MPEWKIKKILDALSPCCHKKKGKLLYALAHYYLKARGLQIIKPNPVVYFCDTLSHALRKTLMPLHILLLF